MTASVFTLIASFQVKHKMIITFLEAQRAKQGNSCSSAAADKMNMKSGEDGEKGGEALRQASLKKKSCLLLSYDNDREPQSG